MKVRNVYYGLRHGISEANEQKMIVSDPSNGVPRYGLSSAGRTMASNMLQLTRTGAGKVMFEPSNTVVYSSDFLRAAQTAEIFCSVHNLPPAIPDTRLRERFFGRLDGGSDSAYDAVWARDASQEGEDTEYGVESCESVCNRLRSFLQDVELAHEGKNIVVASHGDPLGFFQVVMQGLDPKSHKTLPPMRNAELRRMDGK
eukprot:RCo025072